MCGAFVENDIDDVREITITDKEKVFAPSGAIKFVCPFCCRINPAGALRCVGLMAFGI